MPIQIISNKIAKLLFIFFSICPVANASLILDQNRVIYPGAVVQSAMVKISNPTKNDYLIQSWIEDKDGKMQQDIFVDPPLAKIAALHKVALRISAINPALINKPQEQFYWLNVKEIPKIDKALGGAQLAIVMRTRVKIFFRPKEVPADMDSAYKDIEWKHSSAGLQANNPTPYYITFDKVWLNNRKEKNIKADMIPPFSTILIEKGNTTQADTVNYTIINDFGDISDVVQKKVH
ncbi:molecular chaperone [Serratia sp. AKBS12]|uniref:fimbrial biogenesis chaperone n=1 Tax=Serratia sp. AKBS12 TaxID=2974597 RepID=UPI0021656861|nr:molecular chaperone [Serratia sp. AKBS12]MCS3406120.1 molecular chaperone [Serratia sp. AKBS12]